MGLALYPWQKNLVEQLVSLRQAMPNGVLVYGARGIGTFDLVHSFAQSLLCTNPSPEGASCGECKGCKLVQAKTHPDIRYLVSEAEALPRDIPFTPPENASETRKNLYREILIHQPRALGDFLSMKSHEGGLRVVLTYPADQIRAEAAASLLKNLEEPPENTVFLLVADEIDHVLPTIRSRCRLIKAESPSFEEALAYLEKEGVEDAKARLVEAGGQPLSVFETDERLRLEMDEKELLLWVLRKGKNAAVDEAIGAVSRTMSLPAAARLFARWGYDLASVREGGAARYFPQYEKELLALTKDFQAAKLYQWINSVRDVVLISDHPVNSKVVIEEVLLAYARALG